MVGDPTPLGYAATPENPLMQFDHIVPPSTERTFKAGRALPNPNSVAGSSKLTNLASTVIVA